MGNSGSKEDTVTLVVEADDGVKYKLIVDSKPFSEGSFKLAYKARMISPRECDVVVKMPKDGRTMENNYYEVDVKSATKAEELAKAFNEASGTSRPLHFRQPIPMKVITGPQSQFTNGSYVLVEAYLEGEYMKWNNNFDYVNEEDKTSLQAFSHFTYMKTNGKLLICDIQGVKDKNQYSLTDPAIHSDTPGKYGETDLGLIEGMKAFFKKHKCEGYCSKLGLQDRDASCNESEVTEYHVPSQKIENRDNVSNRNDENTMLLHDLLMRRNPQRQHSSQSEKTKFNPQRKSEAATDRPSLETSSEVSIHVEYLATSNQKTASILVSISVHPGQKGPATFSMLQNLLSHMCGKRLFTLYSKIRSLVQIL